MAVAVDVEDAAAVDAGRPLGLARDAGRSLAAGVTSRCGARVAMCRRRGRRLPGRGGRGRGGDGGRRWWGTRRRCRRSGTVERRPRGCRPARCRLGRPAWARAPHARPERQPRGRAECSCSMVRRADRWSPARRPHRASRPAAYLARAEQASVALGAPRLRPIEPRAPRPPRRMAPRRRRARRRARPSHGSSSAGCDRPAAGPRRARCGRSDSRAGTRASRWAARCGGEGAVQARSRCSSLVR